MSRRGEMWEEFSKLVAGHIDGYTVQQYGDYPDDQVSEWSDGECVKQIRKYASRYGNGQRGPVEEDRDLLKIAHYACIAYMKKNGRER